MNLVFNEISFLPYSNNEYVLKDKFLILIKAFERAKELYNVRNFIFPINIRDLNVTPDKNFLEWVYSISHQGEKNKILSVIKRPFTNEVLENQVSDLNKYFFVDTNEGIPESYCNGLATAYIKQWICSSIPLVPIWEMTKIDFYEIINDNFETKQVSVANISKEDSLNNSEIRNFIDFFAEVNILPTTLHPNEKQIALRDDHGKDKLLAFSNRLILSNYVISVINSLPFNPNSINLIRKIYADGKIELVLYWEDKGIGLIIQTTGRNYRETEEIARILKEKFDK